jgi:hypothetical protein
MSVKYAKTAFYGVVAAVMVTAGAAYLLAHLSHVPPAPLEIARKFVDLVKAGDLDGAYQLTNQGGFVGGTRAAFKAMPCDLPSPEERGRCYILRRLTSQSGMLPPFCAVRAHLAMTSRTATTFVRSIFKSSRSCGDADGIECSISFIR